MRDILFDIVAHKRKEVAQQKKALSPKELYALVEEKMANKPKRSLANALKGSPCGIIAEFKRKSPSKGWINADAKVEEIIPQYIKNGAAGLSILTDEHYFGGTSEFIRSARDISQIPILRKDFIVDEYQLFQSCEMGADAILLIASCLSVKECQQFIRIAHDLQLDVLLEIHSTSELPYAELDADMIGVNNRNLGSFVTDVKNSFELVDQLPKDKVKVSESGISNPQVLRDLKEAGFEGFLIGEHFMREDNPGNALHYLISAI